MKYSIFRKEQKVFLKVQSYIYIKDFYDTDNSVLQEIAEQPVQTTC